jgi:hypothetical protein
MRLKGPGDLRIPTLLPVYSVESVWHLRRLLHNDSMNVTFVLILCAPVIVPAAASAFNLGAIPRWGSAAGAHAQTPFGFAFQLQQSRTHTPGPQ